MAKNWGFVTLDSADPTNSDTALVGHLWINTGSGAIFVQTDSPQGNTWLASGGGGGGSQTLAQTLAIGNDANALNIVNAADPVNPQDVDTQAARDAAIAAIPLGIPQGGPLTTSLDADGNEIINIPDIVSPPGNDLSLYAESNASTAAAINLRAGGNGSGIVVHAGRSGGDGGPITLVGKNGTGAGSVGSPITLTGGNSGNGGGGAAIVVEGGDAAGNNGRLTVLTDNTPPDAGLALVGTSDGHLVLGSIIISAGVPSGAPDGSLPLAFDTTAVTGGFYYWSGSAWVKVSNIL